MSDFIVEAADLSKAVRNPVKLIWSREDDIQYGAFRPMCLQRLDAGMDADGNLIAWQHSIIGDGRRLLSSGAKIPYYDIPNQHIEIIGLNHGVRLKHWRASVMGSLSLQLKLSLMKLLYQRELILIISIGR